MDLNISLINLLSNSLNGNTEQITNATNELHKFFFSNKNCVLDLFGVAIADNVPPRVQQLAQVELSKRIQEHWNALDRNEKTQIQSRFLSYIECRPNVSSCIASIAASLVECSLREMEWPEFFLLVEQLAHRGNVTEKLAAVTLIDASLGSLVEYESNGKDRIWALLASSLADSSLDVKIVATQALAKLSAFMTLPATIIDQMFAALQSAFEQMQLESTGKALDAFANLFYFQESLMKQRYLLPLLQLCTTVAVSGQSNPVQTFPFRNQVLNFMLSNLVNALDTLESCASPITDCVASMLRIVLERESPPEAGNLLDILHSDTPPSLARHVISTIILDVQLHDVLPAVLEFLSANFEANTPFSQKNILLLLADLADAPNLNADGWLFELLLKLLSTNPHPMILCAGSVCVTAIANSASDAQIADFIQALLSHVPGSSNCTDLLLQLLSTVSSLLRLTKTIPTRMSEAIFSLVFKLTQSGGAKLQTAAMGLLSDAVRVSDFEGGATLDDKLLALVLERGLVNPGGEDALVRTKCSALLALESIVNVGDSSPSSAQIVSGTLPYLPELVAPDSLDTPIKLAGCKLICTIFQKFKVDDGLERIAANLHQTCRTVTDATDDPEQIKGVSDVLRTIECLFLTRPIKMSSLLDTTLSCVTPLLGFRNSSVRSSAVCCYFGIVKALKSINSETSVALMDQLNRHMMQLSSREEDGDVLVIILEQYAEKVTEIGSALVTGLLPQPLLGLMSDILCETHLCFSDSLNDDSDCDDDDEDNDDDSGCEEKALAVLEACGDLLISLFSVFGSAFFPVYEQFLHKPLMRCFARKAATDEQKCMALGVIGSIASKIAGQLLAIYIPFVPAMLQCLDTLDNHSLVANACYALGYLYERYPNAQELPLGVILEKLVPFLRREIVGDDNLVDNAAAAICRITRKQTDWNTIAFLMPMLLDALPLKADLNETSGVLSCLQYLIAQFPQMALVHKEKLLTLASTFKTSEFKGFESALQLQFEGFSKRLLELLV